MIITFECDDIEIEGYLEELAELGWQIVISTRTENLFTAQPILKPKYRI